jgi:phospholipase A2
MKRMWKVSAAIGIVALFCFGNKWIHADIKDMYQNAKNVAISAKERVNSAISSGMHYFTSEPTAIRINPYKNTIAYVRTGNELNKNEREFLAKREPKVKAAFEKMLGRSLDGKYIPKLAIVASGGGYRAMLGTIGALSAAEAIGFWQAATYATGLSGGTWALASLVSTSKSINQFRNYIAETVKKDIHVASVSEAKNIIDMLSVKLAFDEPITAVDIYGGLLGNRLLNQFGTDAQRIYLSQQAQYIKNADIPYPIYTAIDAREAVAREPHWFEYTPHEIGSSYFGVYVPTWAYGRLFNNGQSLNFAPEQSLGFMMGTWGSAFAVHVGRAWEEIVEKVPGILTSAIEKKLVDPLHGKRIDLSWGEIFNFMYGMPGQELEARKTIKFVDGGIDFNLPYPPISGERPERKADIMIFLDFSGDSLLYSMKKIESYAQKKKLKFPKVDYINLETKAMSVFMDPLDPEVPAVIYFPRISEIGLWDRYKSHENFSKYSSIEGFDFDKCTNEFMGSCGTTRFQYSAENSQKIMDQMEFNIMVHKDQILEVINQVIDKKSSQ